MSFEQNFLEQQNTQDIAQGIIDSCNPNEINHCIKKFFNLTRRFEGELNSEKVKKIKETITQSVAAHLYMHLQKQQFVPTLNRFNCSSYIKPATDAFSVGNNTLDFFTRDKVVSHECNSGVVGKFSPYSSVINTAAMVVPSTIAGPINFSSLNVATVTGAAKEQLSTTFRRILVDDGPESRISALKKFLATTGEIKAKIFEQWLSHVPVVNSRKIIDFKYDPGTNGFADIAAQEYAFNDYSFIDEYDNLSKRIDVTSAGCGNRRFQIHSIDAWLGCPVRSPWLKDIIAFYEAGVQFGDSVFVDTKDKANVLLLRNTFGENIFGVGSSGFMISKIEARVKKFDWVYICDSIKAVNGDFSSGYSTIYKHYLAALDGVQGIVGRRILHITPLLCYSNLFWSALGTNGDSLLHNRVKQWGIAPRKVVNYPLEHFDKPAYHRAKDPPLDTTNLVCLKANIVDQLRAHFFMDPYISEGMVGFVLDSNLRVPFPTIVGNMLVYSKRIHMSLFYMSAIQKNRYKITLGQTSGINYDDDYSMAFSEEAKLIFDAEEEVRVALPPGNNQNPIVPPVQSNDNIRQIAYEGDDEEPS